MNKVTKVTKEKKVIMMTIVRKGAKFTGVKSDKSAKSEKIKEEKSSPKASNGQRFPCPALLSPWFSWGR